VTLPRTQYYLLACEKMRTVTTSYLEQMKMFTNQWTLISPSGWGPVVSFCATGRKKYTPGVPPVNGNGLFLVTLLLILFVLDYDFSPLFVLLVFITPSVNYPLFLFTKSGKLIFPLLIRFLNALFVPCLVILV